MNFVDWLSEIGILLSFSILAGIISGVVVGVLMKTKADKIFDNNTKTVYDSLFEHIGLIDDYKIQIFELWESHPRYKNSTAIVFNPHNYNEIQRFRNLLVEEIEALSLYRNSPYILLSEYLLLQQYALSAYSHLHEISNLENGMGVNEKSLEYHMFYAKEIIEKLPDRAVPKHFADKWNEEFQKKGGIEAVTRPSIKPGDPVDPHYNLRNSVLYFDARYTSIMKILNEIKDAG